MRNLDSFHYALENTEMLLEPERRLETFGTSILNYYLVTEEMDNINHSNVRQGKIVAEKPDIITPEKMSKLLLEGFGQEGEAFVDALGPKLRKLAVLQYGFNLSKKDLKFYQLHEPIQEVCEKVCTEVKSKNDPLSVVMKGVDDAWEVSLLKFMVEMVASSGQSNFKDLKDLGFI
ncbi:MAG: hypothetical protein AAGA18_00060 [Verrucomicrobiota bacterium]